MAVAGILGARAVAAVGRAAYPVPPPHEAAAIVYLGVATPVAFVSWYAGIYRMGVSRTGDFAALVPGGAFVTALVIGASPFQSMRARLRQAEPHELSVLGMEPGGARPVCGIDGVIVVFDSVVGGSECPRACRWAAQVRRTAVARARTPARYGWRSRPRRSSLRHPIRASIPNASMAGPTGSKPGTDPITLN